MSWLINVSFNTGRGNMSETSVTLDIGLITIFKNN